MAQKNSFTFSAEGLLRLLTLRDGAIEYVISRLEDYNSLYDVFGERGRTACKKDIAYHLEFIQASIEFSIIDVFEEYFRWVASLVRSRDIPSEHFVLTLDYLEEMISGDLSESDAAGLALVVAKAKSALLDKAPSEDRTFAKMPAALEECHPFQAAVVSGNRREALDIFCQAIAAGRGFIDTEVHLVQPTFFRIGAGWQENKVSVAQEHLATSIALSILAREFANAEPEPRVNRKAVFACVEGNHHALGLQMVADAFELRGWDVRNIGANTPTAAFLQFVREDKPHLVGLSAAMPHHLPAARETIARLRSELGDACPTLMLGGLAINQFEPASKALGADFTAVEASAAAETATAYFR